MYNTVPHPNKKDNDSNLLFGNSATMQTTCTNEPTAHLRWHTAVGDKWDLAHFGRRVNGACRR